MSGDGGVAPSFHRQSTKRSFSGMAASHRSGSPSSLFVHDEHYSNERSATRRRLHLSPSLPPYFGDGLGFRRPVGTPMGDEAGTMNGGAVGRGGEGTPVIDLTEDDFDHETGDGETFATDETSRLREDQSAAAARQRARLVLRHDENVIDIEDDDGLTEGGAAPTTDNLPGSIYLALPGAHQRQRQHHPRYSMLRRPVQNGPAEHELGDVSGHTRPTPTRESPNPNGVHMSNDPYRAGVAQPIDLTEDDEEDDDDVVITETRQREASGINGAAPAYPNGSGMRNYPERANPLSIAGLLRGGGGRLLSRLQGLPPFDSLQLPLPEINTPPRRVTVPQGAVPSPAHMPPRAPRRYQIFNQQPHPTTWRPGFQGLQNYIGVVMDYTTAGFNLGTTEPERQPTPAYSPPPEAESGFTRSPNEDEILVCPNCGDELAQGELEVKQEVWVIKTCGHAYCGVCARNRTLPASRRTKGKGKNRAAVNEDTDVDSRSSKPPPFKKCVVQDCGKPASMNSLIHVYLGS